MAQFGADLEQLAMLRATLQQQSQVIEQLTTAVRNQLAGTHWDGPAAERFRGEWSSEYEPSLRRLQAALHEAGAEVGRRREAMLQAGV
jgi:WXG100 family type VII secretion target